MTDIEDYKHKCLLCDEMTLNWYCNFHYLEKEARYGMYDIRTLNRGFIWRGIKRVVRFWKYKYIGV